MMDIEKTIREYLPQVIHLSLATSRDNKPWVTEVHYAYDEDLNLYFRSLVSRRHSQEIAQNPYVSGNIVRQFSPEEAVLGVYFEGIAKLLGPGEEQKKAFECIKRRFDTDNEYSKRPRTQKVISFIKSRLTNFMCLEIYMVIRLKNMNSSGVKL